MVCRRPFVPWTELNESPDPSAICRDCKSFVSDDSEAVPSNRNAWERQRRRRRSRHGSSESVESTFSQLIGSARQTRSPQLDDDAALHPRRPSHPRRNWSRRAARRPNSDTDNDSIMDSLFGETDSHVSFGAYGGDSDASFDGRSTMDREIHSPLDNESRGHSDTDIDPMQAGLFELPDEDEDPREMLALLEASMHGSPSSPDSWIRRPVDRFPDAEEIDLSPFTGILGDLMDLPEFELLLEQLAEADSSRRGAPPAAAAAVRDLPRVIISSDHEKKGALVCAVCKDPLPVGAEARQLPCSHLYHPSCILPWLRTRNSCPVCRHELPTDDREYEEGKGGRLRGAVDEIRRREAVDERYSDEASDLGEEADGGDGRGESPSGAGGGGEVDGGSGDGGSGRWLLIAAAPIVAFVGVAVVKWLRNSVAGGRARCGVRDDGTRESRSGMARRVNRNRRRWYFF